MSTPPSDGRYLSARAVREAVDVLEGLAGLLDRVDGVFADDAAGDAARLRDLAATLTEWSPHPPSGGGALPAPRSWEDLLAVYVVHGLDPRRPEARDHRPGPPVSDEDRAALWRMLGDRDAARTTFPARGDDR